MIYKNYGTFVNLVFDLTKSLPGNLDRLKLRVAIYFARAVSNPQEIETKKDETYWGVNCSLIARKGNDHPPSFTPAISTLFPCLSLSFPFHANGASRRPNTPARVLTEPLSIGLVTDRYSLFTRDRWIEYFGNCSSLDLLKLNTLGCHWRANRQTFHFSKGADWVGLFDIYYFLRRKFAGKNSGA